ncbi:MULTISPECIES: hypothetical protein [Lysinibacillus]|uniref:hypothetical protein n=1 Tax=Lysinibacillus TaxID=400634 RepID=UPI00257DC351|nr:MULTISPECIES: hypothetical protein [Lysinibacillus]
MKWENSDNTSETLVDGLSAQLFNTNYTIDIINKNSGSENFFTFLPAFKDALTTPRSSELYGLADFLPYSLKQEEFNRQSQQLVSEILNYQFIDSTQPNSLGQTVNKVHSIEYDTENQTYTLDISVVGVLKCPKINFPAPSVISKKYTSQF